MKIDMRAALFADYIAARMKTPFAWGTHDCMTFAIGWAEIASGKKYLPETLWKTEREAARIIRQRGGLVAVLDATFTRVRPNYAADGDIGIRAGVVSLFSGCYLIAPAADGLDLKPRTEAEHAWTY